MKKQKVRAEIEWTDLWHGSVDGEHFFSYGIMEIVDMVEKGRSFKWTVVGEYPQSKLVGIF